MSFASSITFSPLPRPEVPMPQASEKPVHKSGEKFRKRGEDDAQTCGTDVQVFKERIAQYLRAKYPSKTALCVQAKTRIPARTVENYLDLSVAPSGVNYHRLLLAYPDLLCFVTSDDPAELVRHAERLARQAVLEGQAAAIREQLASLWGGAR